MKRCIVITSIQSPTDALRAMARIPGWTLIVVGDRKTPYDWSCDGVVFLPFAEQASLGFETASALPVGHYARKNLGYLYAMREGAELIYETDDDNILIGTDVPVLPREQEATVVTSPDGFVNVYCLYTERQTWPRGFPLDLIRGSAPIARQRRPVSVPIQQGLANNDPDVDAIYRLVIGELFDFERTGRYAIGEGSTCPFNSQATLWYPEAFWAMMLPGAVPMRVTDIWRGYIALELVRRYGHSLLFTEPTMRQHRNVHNLLRDFLDEIPLYRDARTLVETARAIRRYDDPLDTLTACYDRLAELALVGQDDLRLARAWAADVRAIRRD